jgi:antitoxin PrlF
MAMSIPVFRSVFRRKGQVTIPPEVRKAAHLEEGDPIEVQLVPEGILLRPQKVVDATQTWFWTPAWQAGEREATQDIEKGRTEIFKTGEEFLASLED